MSEVILICGKIGAGKTTYAKRLVTERNAELLSCDEITLLFGQHLGDRHDEVVEKTQKYLLRKAVALMSKGVSVVLDWGFWTKNERDEVSEFFTEHGFDFEWHYIKVSDAVWRDNLNRRNAAFSDTTKDFYFIDDTAADSFGLMFEEPLEYNVLYERK